MSEKQTISREKNKKNIECGKCGIWIARLLVVLAGIAVILLISQEAIQGYIFDFNDKSQFISVSIILFLIVVLLEFRTIISKYEIGKKIEVIVNICLLLLTPLVCFCVEEIIWNIGFQSIKISYCFWNYIILLFLFIPLLLIVQNRKVACGVMLIASFLYGFLNYYVLIYRGCPPLYGDFAAAGTTANVVFEYSFHLTNRMINSLLISLLFFLLIVYLPDLSDFKITIKNRAILLCVGISLLFMYFMMISVLNIEKLTRAYIDWEPYESFLENGAPLTMLVSVKRFYTDGKPDGYSDKYAQELLSKYDNSTANTIRPSVVVIMNESFTDLSVIGDIDTTTVFNNWNNMEGVYLKGYVYSSVLGGGTANSEFEFLTGSSMANIDSSINYPYQAYNLNNSYNIVDLFHSMGYETVAIHPYKRINWNRDIVYDSFGFDEYYSVEMMEDVRNISWCASDEYDYEWVKKIFEKKEGPIFIFNVTMQNHGGYGVSLQVPLESVNPSKYAKYDDVVNIMTLMRESDTAFADLLKYFSEQEEPVIVCMFGDHQMSLSEEVLDEMNYDYTSEDIDIMQKRQKTPYVVWSNYDINLPTNRQVDMSINYLASNILYLMGIHSDYSDYLLELQNNIPVINRNGYATSDMNWHKLEEDNDYVEQYRVVQYYELFKAK